MARRTTTSGPRSSARARDRTGRAGQGQGQALQLPRRIASTTTQPGTTQKHKSSRHSWPASLRRAISAGEPCAPASEPAPRRHQRRQRARRLRRAGDSEVEGLQGLGGRRGCGLRRRCCCCRGGAAVGEGRLRRCCGLGDWLAGWLAGEAPRGAAAACCCCCSRGGAPRGAAAAAAAAAAVAAPGGAARAPRGGEGCVGRAA